MRSTAPPLDSAATLTGTGGVGRSKSWVRIRSIFVRYLFTVPALVFYAVFLIYPAVRTVRLSLTNWDGIAPTWRNVGLKNYERLFQNEIVHLALKNTLI